MLHGRRLRFATLAIISAFLFSSKSFAHDGGAGSHVDVYYSTAGSLTSFITNCPTAFADPSGSSDGELRGGAGANQNTIAVDYTQGAPSSTTLIVVRNTPWPENPTNCNMETAKLTIKRIHLNAQNQLTSTVVRVISNSGIGVGGGCTQAAPLTYCFQWNGEINVDGGGFGRVNGAYELEVEVTSAAVDNTFKRTLTYPGADQFPIKVDATDINTVVSSPTVVGGVPTAPVHIKYKGSKSVPVTIDVFKGNDAGCSMDIDLASGDPNTHSHSVKTPTCPQFVRRVLNNTAQWGVDTNNGQLTNSTPWDGRDNNGNLASSGTYVVSVMAWDPDSGLVGHALPHDQAFRSSFTVTIDPLQITNVTEQPLGSQSTSFAGIGFILTQPATAFLDIWQSSAVFADVNQAPPLTPSNGALLIRRIEGTFSPNTSVSLIWDGRDTNGKFVDDANYRYTLWAQETKVPGSDPSSIVRTAKAHVGILPVTRGFVPVSQVTVTPGSFGSPLVTGVAPYSFTYSLGRDARINLKVLAQNGQFVSNSCATPVCNSVNGCLIANLVVDETRVGGIQITEPPSSAGWDGRTMGLNAGGICPNGIRVSSGVYATELNATDTLFSNRVSTITGFFPVNTLRTANVGATPLLSGATDVATISYVISEAMNVRWTIYPPTTTFTGTWPALVASAPATRTIFGPRPGKLKITESWDGRNDAGFFVPDGNYISVLTADEAGGGSSTDQVVKEIVVSRGQIAILNPAVSPTFPSIENASSTLRIPVAPFEIAYTLSRDANVTVSIKTQDGVFITSLTNAEPRSGSIVNKEFWDGTNFTGVRLTSANLFVDILAQDQATILLSSSVARLPLAINLLRIYDVAVTPLTPGAQDAQISYQLSEAMNVDLRIFRPGTLFNAAGVPVPPESQSLVFKISGARPGRVGINESWPGINLYQKQVQDGNYVFRLTGTDELGSQAADIITGQISSLRLAFADPQATLEDQTFAYPNPIKKGGQLKICTLIPVDATVNLKIFTLSGELVWQKELGFKAGGTAMCGSSAITWNMDNNWGRKIAHGVYFYVLRADSVGGQTQFLQTIKKIMVKN